MSHVWQLQVRGEFSAAHALRNYRGKCENLHGHNFSVEMCVQGSHLAADTEMLIDFKELKNILKSCLADLDHHLLNQTAPFDKINPTSENLARYIFRACSKALAHNCPARVVSVTVGEKPGQSATYLEFEDSSD